MPATESPAVLVADDLCARLLWRYDRPPLEFEKRCHDLAVWGSEHFLRARELRKRGEEDDAKREERAAQAYADASAELWRSATQPLTEEAAAKAEAVPVAKKKARRATSR